MTCPPHPYGVVVENWPCHWPTDRGGSTCLVMPLPGPATRRMSIGGWSGWPRMYYDPQDPETAWCFYLQSARYWSSVREGDIYIDGPFAGLVAH